MKKYFFFSCIVVLLASCKLLSGSDSHYTGFDESKIYRLQLNPVSGSKYYYEVANESNVELEVNDKKVTNVNKSTVGAYYDIAKDSSGNFLFQIQYDKIHLFTKNGDTQSELDADNAANSINPVEKMLGVLKSANIITTINPVGVVEGIKGYKEMGEQLMASFTAANDAYAKNMVQSQWEKVLGESLVKKNIEQLFNIFPDSAVHVGEKWKLNSKQSGEINLDINTLFKLKTINEGIAIIEAEGEVTSDSANSNLMGYNVTANLKGRQQGQYEVDTRTGMVINSRVTVTVNGVLQMLGKEIPVVIENKAKMSGRKIK